MPPLVARLPATGRPGPAPRPRAADGLGKSSTIVAALVDTNVLVYRVDSGDVRKQKIATEILRRGLADQSIRIPLQAIVEFYAAVTRSRRGFTPLLSAADATRETEELLAVFDVLYPTEDVIRGALLATAAYQLQWYDAQIWAYAATNGLTEIVSEDFQHGRRYGTVRVVNPFLQ
jgi:predicted nucleic acid-binding protein